MSRNKAPSPRKREQARKRALALKREVDAAREHRDQLEADLIAEFLLRFDEQNELKADLQQVRTEMGRVVDRMVGGELRLSYSRVERLLRTKEADLKQLRQLVRDAESEPPASPDQRDPRRPSSSAEAGFDSDPQTRDPAA
ncbi:hypothetical protein [Amycolatopsis sp. GM8]|uniref:hypothetical protein n=1 Tax=Amycolatopsis sp. GM8 TaxID=2896530 RepID=UPI001F449521|nr:hypothetical protein [Amycolatopsis sp. GM8]